MVKKIRIYILPFISLIIIIGFFIFTKPTPTGMAVLDINSSPERTITAKVTLKLSKNELIPESALVIVMLDDRKASMPIKKFIEISKQPYNYIKGELDIVNYKGYGYVGDYTYSIDLENFDLDKKIFTGDHTFTTKIVYNNKVLYEKETIFTVENA